MREGGEEGYEAKEIPSRFHARRSLQSPKLGPDQKPSRSSRVVLGEIHRVILSQRSWQVLLNSNTSVGTVG